MSERMVVEARGLVKTYQLGAEPVPVLQDIDLVVHSGESVSIVGASGAGKSTLLHILGTLDRPTGGELLIDGTPISGLSDGKLAALRNDKIGFVFQFHHLLSEFTALENVMMPGLIAGENTQAMRERAETLLTGVGLGTRLRHKPGELSGGEQQRVAVARALVRDPVLLLADEPTGNLDRVNGDALADLLLDLCRNGHQALVLVTHNEQLTRRTDRVLELCDGKMRPYTHEN